MKSCNNCTKFGVCKIRDKVYDTYVKLAQMSERKDKVLEELLEELAKRCWAYEKSKG